MELLRPINEGLRVKVRNFADLKSKKLMEDKLYEKVSSKFLNGKIPDIYVMSKSEVQKFPFDSEECFDRLYAVMSIFTPGYRSAEIRLNRKSWEKGNVGFFPFYDTDKKMSVFDLELHKIVDLRPLDNAETDRIVTFILNKIFEVDVFVVQCEAGISRSGGVTAALLYWIYGDDSRVYGMDSSLYGFRQRSYQPNRWVYKKVLDMLESKRSLLHEGFWSVRYGLG